MTLVWFLLWLALVIVTVAVGWAIYGFMYLVGSIILYLEERKPPP